MTEITSQFIPQTNPKAGYLAQKCEIDEAIQRVLDSGWYILGAEVDAFESEFAEYLGVKHGIGVASGTDALELALRACDICAGDVIFTVAHTAVATVAAIESVGAIPVLLDIEPETLTLDPQALERAISSEWGSKAKAVIPVHLYGHPAAMRDIKEIAEQAGLFVVEDCAQAHGAELFGRKAGAWGDIAAFSFYPTKNLGALGDGGMVVTNNTEFAHRVRQLRQYGWQNKKFSVIPGFNSRLDEIQAAILRVNLNKLDSMNERRRSIANQYNAAFTSTGIRLPFCNSDAKHVFHQYVIRYSRRDEFRAFLREHNIQTLIHYAKAVHHQPAYAGRVQVCGALKNTEAAVQEIVSLPLYPELKDEEVERVTEIVAKWISL